MTPAPIALTGVTLRRGGRDIVRGLTGIFAPGSLTAVAGPNGAGKSTLLQTLAGLRPPAAGRIEGAGDSALLAQDGRLERGFPIAVRDAVALGATARTGLFRRIGPEANGAADAALQAAGLSGLGARPIGELSVGQFQRVLFARTMVRDAPIVLLDEPFAAVDAATEASLMDIVRAWHREGRTVIAVLHDAELIRDAFPQTLLLGSDRPAWGPTAEVLPRHRARAVIVAGPVPVADPVATCGVSPVADASAALAPASSTGTSSPSTPWAAEAAA
jgi:zinc/manganese transport system ATP-binding protein